MHRRGRTRSKATTSIRIVQPRASGLALPASKTKARSIEHRAKPPEFYDLIRAHTLGRRLDMFNRRKIVGLGNESAENAGAAWQGMLLFKRLPFERVPRNVPLHRTVTMFIFTRDA